MADPRPASPDVAAELRRAINRLSARHPDGLSTAALADALAADGWSRCPCRLETGEGGETDGRDDEQGFPAAGA